MKLFQCGNCEHSLFFENSVCENCGHLAGYRDAAREVLTFAAEAREMISDRAGVRYRYCANNVYDVCNWLIPAGSPHQYCRACQLNRTVPNLADPANVTKWQSLENAKHRLVYQLQRLGLPLVSKLVDEEVGLCFDFVARDGRADLMTGHAEGVVTILLSEADSVVREENRKQFKEPYRTLIGHLRHEVGHYYWDRLVAADDDALAAFRRQFGDERRDYGEALQAYYASGAPEGWRAAHISAYATAHPWEDWAETWAHYLHIVDMVETAYYFGVAVDPVGPMDTMATDVPFDPYDATDFDVIVERAVPLSYAVNSINRAMGIPDVYPFVISTRVREKLTFVHELVATRRRASALAN